MMFLMLLMLPMQGLAQDNIERKFERSDGAELNILYEFGKPAILMVYVPLTGVAEGEENAIVIIEHLEKTRKREYLIKFEGNTWKVLEAKDSWSMECVEGDCFDKDNRKGIWKEAFTEVK